MSQLVSLIMSNPYSKSRPHEQSVISAIHSVQDEFDDCFSIFPFLVFGANFFTISGYLLFVLYEHESFSWDKVSIILTTLSCLMIPVLKCGTARSKYKSAAQAIALLQEDNMTAHEIQMVNQIREIVKRKESGWLFELDNRTILPFAGHIISFAVIFLQLLPPQSSSQY